MVEHPRIIISLTSYPARIHSVYKVIESLFLQIKKADKIILWLSEQDFLQGKVELPVELLQLEEKNGFCIRWVKENLKSHKKYFYVLQECPNDIVITVDDDMYYAKTMISTLLKSYVKHPNAISARNVHRIFRNGKEITPYLTWDGKPSEYIDVERMDLCAIGVNGILYPPRCSSEKWFDYEMIQDYAENQDDLWLKYNEILDNIPVVYTGVDENDVIIQETQESVLYIKNAHEGGNDNCIKKLVRQVVGKDADIFHNWTNQLMPIDDYLLEREAFYRKMFRKFFDDYAGGNIYICGAGKFASILLEAIEKFGGNTINIKALLVSRISEISLLRNVKIQEISELNKEEAFTVLCGVSEKYKEEFKDIFSKYEMCEWIEFDIREIYDYIMILRAVHENNK